MHDNPIDRHIAEEVSEKKGNLNKVARELGISFEYLQSRFGDTPSSSTFVPTLAPIPADIKTLGKKGFERFVVAVKRRGCVWPKQFDAAIKDARTKFDAGTHEMYQSISGGFVVQYLIPRRRPVEPRRFFRSIYVV